MKENQNKYENEFSKIEEVQNTEIKINPSFYIHLCLINAGEALKTTNLSEAFVHYRLHIERAVRLAKAANLLGEDYEEDVKKFKDSEEYKGEEENQYKSMRLAEHKELLVSEALFNSVPLTDPIKA